MLHICCANCALIPVTEFRARGYEVTGFWFNPNIEPKAEYNRRHEAVMHLAGLWDLPLIEADGYANEVYRTAVHSREDKPHRCLACYEIRLRKTAHEALSSECEAFSTSLIFSPYQNHEAIRQTGERISQETGVAFLYEDFRQEYSRGMEISRELKLYSQYYCGCLFSKQERDVERAMRKKNRETVNQ